MPRQQAQNSTNNKEALTQAVLEAREPGDVWALLRRWRKKEFDALLAISEHTPVWDEGMVRILCVHSSLLQRAVMAPMGNRGTRRQVPPLSLPMDKSRGF